MGLIAELKRRNVFKVAMAYLLLAWLIMQLGDVLAPALHLPDWVPSMLAFFLILGFPLTIFLAWAFELTTEGVKLEKDTPEGSSRAAKTGRLLTFTIVGLLSLTIAHLFWDSRIADNEREASSEAMSGGLPSGRLDTAAPTDPVVSIAVLPFVNVSQDTNQDYFSDGITEEIINSLVKIPGISVPARTSVFAFKGQQGDIREIGQSLGVAHILEGSVRSLGNEAVITASLIQVSDGSRLWSDRFERRLENIFALQEELATAIAAELRVELVGIEVVPNRTRDISAYDSYLQGRSALRERQNNAVALLEQSTKSDPTFAPAWASLAIAYQTDPRMTNQAIDAAERALAIDPDNVDALTALASIYRQTREWARSESHFQRALAIDPASAELLEDYAEFLNLVGRSKKALEVTTMAMEIDGRLAPLAAAHAEALFSNEETLKARQVAEESLQAFENYSGVWWALLPLWLSPIDGNLAPLPPTRSAPNAVSYIQQVLQSSPSASVNSLKEAMMPRSEDNAAIPIDRRTVRLLLLHLGEVDFVIDRDIADHSEFPNPLREWLWTPYFEAFRQHARFPEFLSRVGLIEYWDRSGFPDRCRRSLTDEIDCE